MARTRKVTRTIQSLMVNVLCLDVATCEPMNQLVEVPRRKDEKEVMAAVKEKLAGGTIRPVEIVDITTKENTYVMKEDDFIKHATVKEKKKLTQNKEE